MGILLPFQTKAERAAAAPVPDTGPQTPPQVYQQLYTVTLLHCRELVAMYRKTGKWTPESEDDMIGVVHKLQMICARLAGSTGDTDGQENVG